MGLREEIAAEKARSVARNKRYKKPLHSEMNMEAVWSFCSEATEAAAEVAYTMQNDDVFVEALGGDEEEAEAFRAAFGTLETDLEQFAEDLEEQWVPECFDIWFAGVSTKNDPMLVGYDGYEGDYFGLDAYEADLARKEARAKLARMTKAELIEAGEQCFRVAQQYMSLKFRMDTLQDGIDLVRGINNGLIEGINKINQAYDAMERERTDVVWDKGREREFDRLTAMLPAECWLR